MLQVRLACLVARLILTGKCLLYTLADLTTSVNIEVLRPLLTDQSFMERVRDKLPATTDTPPSTTSGIAEQFTSTVQSPQFQQALSSFCSVLQSGQLGPVVQQFGLSDECIAAANGGSMFLEKYLNFDFLTNLFNSIKQI